MMQLLHCSILVLAVVPFGLASTIILSQSDLNEYCKKDGLHPGPDCFNYVSCTSGAASLLDCPATLKFNTKRLCDNPENVDCEDY